MQSIQKVTNELRQTIQQNHNTYIKQQTNISNKYEQSRKKAKINANKDSETVAQLKRQIFILEKIQKIGNNILPLQMSKVKEIKQQYQKFIEKAEYDQRTQEQNSNIYDINQQNLINDQNPISNECFTCTKFKNEFEQSKNLKNVKMIQSYTQNISKQKIITFFLKAFQVLTVMIAIAISVFMFIN